MDAIIKLEDIIVKEWEKAKIEFDVVDQENNPVSGRVAVKINQETKFDTNIEDGKFCTPLYILGYPFSAGTAPYFLIVCSAI